MPRHIGGDLGKGRAAHAVIGRATRCGYAHPARTRHARFDVLAAGAVSCG